jgi:ribosome modulation factor
MSVQPYPSPERLMAQLDGARLVRYDSAGLVLAWFGGHGVHVYDGTGEEVDYWTCGDFATNDADLSDVESSIARHMLDVEDVLERAEQEGYEAGKAAGSWLLDGNSSEETARRLLAGIEDGDPEILEALPSSPLSGECADGLMPRDVLGWYDLDEEHDAADDVLRAFEDGYDRGVQDEATRSARAFLV